MQMKNVYSSHVDSIGYDPKTKELHVQYAGPRGKFAVYSDVPQEVAGNVINATSIGQALHQHVRGKFSHTYPGDV